MNRIGDSLRKALREPEAPADLAERVLARAAQSQRRRLFSRPALRIAASIGVAAALAAGFHYERQREERLATERAREKVLEAFRLAEQQLKPFRERLEAVQPRQ